MLVCYSVSIIWRIFWGFVECPVLKPKVTLTLLSIRLMILLTFLISWPEVYFLVSVPLLIKMLHRLFMFRTMISSFPYSSELTFSWYFIAFIILVWNTYICGDFNHFTVNFITIIKRCSKPINSQSCHIHFYNE